MVQKKHKHKLQFMHIEYQYPSGLSGTSVAQEYAYFLCLGCEQVIKKEVQFDSLPPQKEGKGSVTKKEGK